MAWVNPITFVSGLVTSAMLNTIRDALKAIGDPWTSYSPTLTAVTTNPTAGASSYTGRYRRTGNTGDAHMDFILGTGFAAGSGTYRFALPPSWTPFLTNVGEVMGVATVRDASSGLTHGPFAVSFNATAGIVIAEDSGGTISATYIGVAAPPAVGDMISIHLANVELA